MSDREQYGEFAVTALEETMHDGFYERTFSVTDSKVRLQVGQGATSSFTPLPHDLAWQAVPPSLALNSSYVYYTCIVGH